MLDDWDIKFMKDLNGDPQEGIYWGARMSLALSELTASGHLECVSEEGKTAYFLTDKGRAAIGAAEQ